MKFSLKRSRTVNFIDAICNSILPCVSEVKDLGVIFTTNFNFNKHIEALTSKSFRMIGLLRRVLKPFKDLVVFKNMCFSLIRSRLEYCANILSPAKHMVEKIEYVQKIFLKFM